MIFALVSMVDAQINLQTNTFPDSGNAGIGTLSPTEALEVRGKIMATSAIFTNAPTGTHIFSDNHDRVETSRIFSGGTLLDIGGQRTINFYDFPQSNMNIIPRVWFSIVDRSYMDRFRFWADMGGESRFSLYNKDQEERFVVEETNSGTYLRLPHQDSYVSIGTSSYTDNGETYKLNVNGKVRALGVKVYTNWADFVFYENYELPTLLEVEQYIKENGHLKDIPSEVEVEQNGIELGEMNKLLLQKIEELTLYLIEKDKQFRILENEIKILKEKINKK